MKNSILSICIVLLLIPCFLQAKGRRQWTEKQAWEWQKKVGVIKGFNEPFEAYPGMSRKQILQKAAESGFNSVRFWIQGNNAEEQIAYIKGMADDAAACGLTISPVLSIDYIYFRQKDKVKAFAGAKEYTQQVVGAFAHDKRVILWDIWNEPLFDGSPDMYKQIDWIEAAVGWCREMSPVQPITSSMFWDTDVSADAESKAITRRCEVEAMMDVHNFHHYECGHDRMKRIETMVKRLQKINDRPLVCTECIARSKGSTFARTFVAFSQYHVNFYTWGLYICDRNWAVLWGQSTYNPYEPMFHELFHPDGEPYDRRELDWLRNFKFSPNHENADPGAEITERWTKDRAWKWMVTGPIKGAAWQEGKQSYMEEYNGLRVKCDYNAWKENKESFFQKMDNLLSEAGKSNRRVVPALLSDENINEKDSALANYVAEVIRRYITDPRIEAWEIYTHPGAIETNTAKLGGLLHLLFRFARFEYPNQPLTATPYLSVKDFPKDFNYKEALVHGHTAGWNQLVCKGGSTPELCNLVWQLSDVISFSSNQEAPETGWLTSIAYRYGRPLICTEWNPASPEAAKQTLDIFAKSHVFWYNCSNWYDQQLIDHFSFKPITTIFK